MLYENNTAILQEVNSIVNISSEHKDLTREEKITVIDKLEPSHEIKIDNVHSEFNSAAEKYTPETLTDQLDSANQ